MNLLITGPLLALLSDALESNIRASLLKDLKAPLVIPMHYFSSFTLSRFLDAARADFEIKTSAEPSVVVSRATLPSKPQILVLPGG